MTTERRESFRCQTGGDDSPQRGVLHTCRGDVTVKLTDRSSGGFGVRLPAECQSQVNESEEVAFTTGGETALVRVAHRSECDEGVLIGLEVLRELPTHFDKRFNKRNRADGSSGRLLRFGMLTACALLIALNVPWSKAFSAFRSGESPETAASELPPRAETPIASRTQQSNEVQLANQFVRLDQLTSRQAATRLNLSDSQQREIGSIVKETTDSMEILFENRESISGVEWATLGLSLLQNSARRIEGTLNEKQRAEWASLIEGVPEGRGDSER